MPTGGPVGIGALVSARRCSGGALLAIALLAASLVGCADGIRWRGYAYEPVLAESRQQNKLTFVYFRSWYSVQCTRFEENVLKDRAVLDATADLYCVALDYDADRALADTFGLSKPPAYAIVDPQGKLLTSGAGEISRDSLLEAINKAKNPPKTVAPQGARVIDIP